MPSMTTLWNNEFMTCTELIQGHWTKYRWYLNWLALHQKVQNRAILPGQLGPTCNIQINQGTIPREMHSECFILWNGEIRFRLSLSDLFVHTAVNLTWTLQQWCRMPGLSFKTGWTLHLVRGRREFDVESWGAKYFLANPLKLCDVNLSNTWVLIIFIFVEFLSSYLLSARLIQNVRSAPQNAG
jgi:hypothetical protein